jgi:hypothetical protein
MFDFFKQAYLLTARWAHDTISASEDVDDATRHRARFYFDQIANAMAPSNFAFTNPEVLKQTLASSGQNLVDGMTNLARDIEAGQGSLKITQTDMGAFALGENMALTPGRWSTRTTMMQLIQYAPATRKVREVPLLIVPPWINKFYILDLNPKKSFISWCVDKGLTVFVISWVNPDAASPRKAFRRLHARRHSGGADPDREADRPEAGQCHRLLHRRHAAGLNAGLHGCQGREPHQVGDLLHHQDRLHLRRRPEGVRRRRTDFGG